MTKKRTTPEEEQLATKLENTELKKEILRLQRQIAKMRVGEVMRENGIKIKAEADIEAARQEEEERDDLGRSLARRARAARAKKRL